MKNKLKVFIKQNGFLLLLFMCVCVVAAGTIFIATRDLKTAKNSKDKDLVILEEVKDSENGEDIALENVEVSLIEDTSINEENVKDNLLTDGDSEKKEMSDDQLVTEQDLVENNEEDIKETLNEDNIEYVEEYEEEEDDIEVVTDKPVSAILAVEGEIITEYSIDKLVYSNTLEEWRGHNGIDIKAPLGTKVKAPLNGVIKEVTENDLWGITIVIDHGDGLESKFSNLGTLEMVKSGIKVNKGDYISTVGNSATIEMLMEPHIHFEVTKNGKIVDPRSITN